MVGIGHLWNHGLGGLGKSVTADDEAGGKGGQQENSEAHLQSQHPSQFVKRNRSHEFRATLALSAIYRGWRSLNLHVCSCDSQKLKMSLQRIAPVFKSFDSSGTNFGRFGSRAVSKCFFLRNCLIFALAYALRDGHQNLNYAKLKQAKLKLKLYTT